MNCIHGQYVEDKKPVKGPGPKSVAVEHLERTLPRNPGDLLKVFPMPDRQAFRVNWYASRTPEKATISGLKIAYVRDSKFLFCRLNAEGAPEITYPAKQ